MGQTQQAPEALVFSNDWMHYQTALEGYDALLGVDLSAPELGSDHHHTRFIRVAYEGDEAGLPTKADLRRLKQITHTIHTHLLNDALTAAHVRHVGHIYSHGVADLVYVSNADLAWPQSIAAALAEEEDVDYVAATFPDDQWAFYFETLYPSAVDLALDYTQKTCQQLRRSGDALLQARPVDYYASFPSEGAAKRFVKSLPADFVVAAMEAEEEGPNAWWAVQFGANAVPDLATMTDWVNQLLPLVVAVEGQFDGWGTEALADKTVSA
ncbi:MAG: DUF695 domain-containing protein [Neisseriaceae bacterium]|nr:DUF695 domain-containing protein [Neisseriaceae bacterium]MBP6863273.1 DUF695 domain-containing protein [Neisseriaceae bacterium]